MKDKITLYVLYQAIDECDFGKIISAKTSKETRPTSNTSW